MTGTDEAGDLVIQDPAEGTTYTMMESEFLENWNGKAVFSGNPA